MLAAAVFFAIAYVINHSGKGADWALAEPGAQHGQRPRRRSAAAPSARSTRWSRRSSGLLGGFISGSEASAIAMLTKLHLTTAEKIGACGPARRGGQRHRRRAGERDLAGQAPERRRPHRPHRRGGQVIPARSRDLDHHHRRVRGHDAFYELSTAAPAATQSSPSHQEGPSIIFPSPCGRGQGRGHCISEPWTPSPYASPS